VLLSEGEEISGLEFGDGFTAPEDIHLEGDLPATVARYATDLEKRLIRSVLQENGGNVSRSAARLGISRKTLYEKMRRHQL
jgi:transcriptional regulator of acetoin/glycerol metabolism